MAKISDLSDELLVKILSFLPTRVAVSTSVLSKQWEFLWMWLPKLEYDDYDHITDLSRCVRELSIGLSHFNVVSLPSSLYTCKSLVTLKLEGEKVLVDVPRTVFLPSLKTLQLERVTYSTEDSLRLLLSYCPVLEDLSIVRDENDNLRAHMPELEEADIVVLQDPEKLLESVTFFKRLSIRVIFNSSIQTVYRNGIVFNRLENLKLCICNDDWSKLLVQLLKDSPNLRVLNLLVDDYPSIYGEYEPVRWKNNKSSVPKCLLNSLETFEFAGYMGGPEERDFLSFIFKHARRLKSSSILRGSERYYGF
ncbi:unnamed protein product [Arabidopsis lyrata]|nr:unnamed protein product [Arabidopsis lyrata]